MCMFNAICLVKVCAISVQFKAIIDIDKSLWTLINHMNLQFKNMKVAFKLKKNISMEGSKSNENRFCL